MQALLLNTILITYVFAGMTCGGSSGTTGSASGTTSGSSSGTTSGSSSGRAEPYYGTVAFTQSTVSNKPFFDVTAELFATPSGGAAPFCPSPGVQNGSCCYIPPLTATGTSGSLPTFLSAGAISITDGATSLGTLAFSSGGTGYAPLSSVATPSVTWAGGDTLSVSAAGDSSAVAAFSGSITAPAALVVSTPTLPGAITISRSTDFTVSWTAGPSGPTNNVALTIVDATQHSTVACLLSDSAGTVDVPSALLGMTAAGDTGTIDLVREPAVDASTPSANANVGLVASTTVTGTVTLQ